MNLTKTRPTRVIVPLDERSIQVQDKEEPTEELLCFAAQEYKRYSEAEKAAKEAKERTRDHLHMLMTTAVQEENLAAKQSIVVSDDEVAQFGTLEAWLAHYYPGWILYSMQKDGENAEFYVLAIGEDPSLVKYEFEADGFRFGRTTTLRGADFKVSEFYDSLEEVEDRELHEELESCVDVSYEPQFAFNEERAQDVMVSRPETTAYFKRFMFPGKPTSSMIPIGKVKSEA